MTRKLILTLAAAATVAAATVTLGSSAVYARGFGGGGMSRGGGHVSMGAGHARMAMTHNSGRIGRPVRASRISRPGRPILIPIGHLHPPHHHHHHHWVFRGGRWIVLDEVVVGGEAVAPAAVPGPCTCLTKTYTPTGLVVFADVCTKESASAPAQDDTADASQAPTTNVPAKQTPMSEVPTKPNYAGRTYDNYLAANPQLKPQAAVQDPQSK